MEPTDRSRKLGEKHHKRRDKVKPEADLSNKIEVSESDITQYDYYLNSQSIKHD